MVNVTLLDVNKYSNTLGPGLLPFRAAIRVFTEAWSTILLLPQAQLFLQGNKNIPFISVYRMDD